MPASRTAEPIVLEILNEESQLCRRMLRVAEAKREALLAADVDALAPLVREMEGIAQRLEDLEGERLASMAAFTAGEGGHRQSWRDLLPQLDESQATRLASLRGELAASLQSLHAVNTANAGMVRQALDFNERWSRVLRNALPSTTYGAQGTATAPRLLRRAWIA